jgi:hypothetical protein
MGTKPLPYIALIAEQILQPNPRKRHAPHGTAAPSPPTSHLPTLVEVSTALGMFITVQAHAVTFASALAEVIRMPEYIAKSAAMEIVKRTSGDYAAAFSEIRKLPAADVAEVVRCKDCCYWNRKYTTVGECEKLADRDQEGGSQFDCDMDNDDFCSYGKRKDGGSNDE